MSKPTDKLCTASRLSGFVNMLAEGLAKAYQPCQEHCMEKCQRAWDQNKPSEQCSADSPSMKYCVWECRDFQNRSPANRDY